MPSNYLIKRIKNGTLAGADWQHPLWQSANELSIASFHPQSSNHHPRTLVRLLYDDQNIYCRYEVHDQYIVSKSTTYQSMVCEDSCAEFFAQPKVGKGYFNFETNCGGTLLLFYIEDHTRTPTAFVKYTEVPKAIADTIKIQHSLPPVIKPEITTPTTWHLTAQIPFSLFEHFVGPLGNLSGTTWRSNFFKCADLSSHPHWGSWSPLGNNLNFHLPDKFGEIRFE